MASGVGGSAPLTTTPLRFLHVRLTKNNTAANRISKTNVAPTLMPAVAPMERPEELLLCGFTGFVTEAELGAVVVAVVSDVPVGLAEVIDVMETLELAKVLDALGVLEFFDEVELVEVLEVDVAVCVVCDFLNGAALLGLLESFAATTSSSGHSVLQALEEQHPKKG